MAGPTKRTGKRQTSAAKTASATNAEAATLQPQPQEQSIWVERMNMAIWVLLAWGLVYQVDLINEIREHAFGLSSYALTLGCSAFLLSFANILFILPRSLGRPVNMDQWQTECRGSVRTGAVGLVSAISAMVYICWPAFGVASFGLVFVLTMGAIKAMDLVASLSNHAGLNLI